ncbi:Glycosyltransferase involved in cell wall bisynthesis [Arsukibacterium tuosuense]|uniref:Glycosyltransferase involved in cell wall bisynthesis n=1 Tax=Arsukibacterium tuosuense TaxID=1323745 RepID=A0A285IY71_9GAMM|nr:glycosyltransferase family 4 protein [Arsukibacterium tuosuense]SNY51851.1 Glycosyltransferase involved in cell wall bisynthesis [Arsukibacterium tuosuense]
MTTPKKRLLYIVNVDWFFISHWLPLARAAKLDGYDVHIATTVTQKTDVMLAEGFTCHEIPINRSGTNPLTEIVVAIRIFRLIKSLKPDIVHLMTIKPVIYGGIAARLAKVPAVVVGITGLGFVFINESKKIKILRSIVVKLYKAVFRHKNIFITFENESDRAVFLQGNIVKPEQAQVVNGAGVDLTNFSHKPEPENPVVITFAARLLKDKGFFEFVAAAKMLKPQCGDSVSFWVVGTPDFVNPASVTQHEIDKLAIEKNVIFHGFRSDMADVLSNSNIVVLPSYREGLPKVLMEAAACGRAVITTDVPGCRHVIIPGKTGLLVPPGHVDALAEAMLQLARNANLRHNFGTQGRVLAEKRFNIVKISTDYLSMYQKLLSRTV